MTTPAKQTSAQFAPLGTVSAPADWNIPSNIVLSPSVVFAHFDGSAAAGSFVPTLQILSDSGHVVAEIPQDVTVAAGSSCEATWAPFLKTAVQGGMVPPVGPVVGYDAYAVYTAGQSGNFNLPLTAKMLLVVAVGGGGGGGSGGRSNADATRQGPGSGGGGGAAIPVWHDCARLASLYPSGIPYSVGSGGSGGAARTSGANQNGADGTAGTQTTFGLQVAGGGGRGRGGSASNISAGNGGGLLSGDQSGTFGGQLGTFASEGGAQQSNGTWPGPAEYGGGAGAVCAASIAIGTPAPGFQGASSLWGGGGGGGGAAWTNIGSQKGGQGGLSGAYVVQSNSGNGTNAAGTLTGLWAGSGGDGGDAQTAGGNNAHDGGAGGTAGGGGGGGGGAGSASSGAGGAGGGGILIIYAFG